MPISNGLGLDAVKLGANFSQSMLVIVSDVWPSSTACCSAVIASSGFIVWTPRRRSCSAPSSFSDAIPESAQAPHAIDVA